MFGYSVWIKGWRGYKKKVWLVYEIGFCENWEWFMVVVGFLFLKMVKEGCKVFFLIN